MKEDRWKNTLGKNASLITFPEKNNEIDKLNNWHLRNISKEPRKIVGIGKRLFRVKWRTARNSREICFRQAKMYRSEGIDFIFKVLIWSSLAFRSWGAERIGIKRKIVGGRISRVEKRVGHVWLFRFGVYRFGVFHFERIESAWEFSHIIFETGLWHLKRSRKLRSSQTRI